MEGEGNEVKHSMLWEEIAPGVNKKPNLINLFGMDLGDLTLSCMVNQASLSYLNQASLKVSIAILTLSIEFLLRFFTLQIALFD